MLKVSKANVVQPAISYLHPDPPVLLGQVARRIIDSNLGVQTEAGPLEIPSSSWPFLWAVLKKQRSASLLAMAVHSGHVVIGETERDVVDEQAASGAVLQLMLCEGAKRAVELVEQNDLEIRIVKGIASALLDYPYPGLRQTSDIDLLCRKKDFDQVCRIFVAAGHRARRRNQPTDIMVEVTFDTDAGVELDLHHRLFRFGSADDWMFESPQPLPEGWGETISPESRLIHAAGHLLISPPGHRQLSSLVDVAMIGANPLLDEGQLQRQAEQIGIEGLVRFARWMARNVGLEAPEDQPLLERSSINRAYIRTERSTTRETLAVLNDLDSMHDRSRYLRYQLRRHRR